MWFAPPISAFRRNKKAASHTPSTSTREIFVQAHRLDPTKPKHALNAYTLLHCLAHLICTCTCTCTCTHTCSCTHADEHTHTHTKPHTQNNIHIHPTPRITSTSPTHTKPHIHTHTQAHIHTQLHTAPKHTQTHLRSAASISTSSGSKSGSTGALSSRPVLGIWRMHASHIGFKK